MPGEIWQQRGPWVTLFALYLLDIAAVRPWVPAALRIQPVLPGKTLGSVFLTYYGPGSTLEYHELIIAPALAGTGGRHGWWVSHIYVDDARSMAGGRALGLGKEMAEFDWDGDAPGAATVRQGEREIATVRYGRRVGAVRIPLGSYGVSVMDGTVLRSWQSLTATWGVTGCTVTIPPESPAAPLAPLLRRPLVAVMGHDMRGEMCVDLTTIGRITP